MAQATNNQSRYTAPIGLNQGVTTVSKAPPATIDKVAIRNLLNQGNKEKLIEQLRGAGNFELDLSEPEKIASSWNLERETTLGLTETGVTTLVSLLKNDEVKLTKLTLGYLPDCSPIFECLDSVTHLESLDVSRMRTARPDGSMSCDLIPSHIKSLVGLFEKKLTEASKFKELIVSAATYEDGFVQLASVNTKLSATLNRYYGDRSLDKVVRFVDPDRTVCAPMLQLFATQRDACGYLLGFLQAGDAEGFKAALECTFVEPSCAVTVLDLTRLLATLSRKGAAALGAALCDSSVQLIKVVLGTVVETLEPILQALPSSNVRLLDLSNANLWVTDGVLPKCRYLGKQEFDQIRALSAASIPTTTQIKLNSWYLSQEDRCAWTGMMASNVTIDETSRPPTSYVPPSNNAPSVAPAKAPIRSERNNVAVNSKIEDQAKHAAAKLVDQNMASSDISAPLVFTDEKAASSYFHSLLEAGNAAEIETALKRSSPAVTALDLTSFGRLSEKAVATLGIVLGDSSSRLKELALDAENQFIVPILQALPDSSLKKLTLAKN